MSETQEPGEKYSHPNRGTLGQPPMGGGDHLYLSADQIRTSDDSPSWKAPPSGRWSTASLVAIVIAVAVLLLLVLWAAGVI
jgi:hypothetical protein